MSTWTSHTHRDGSVTFWPNAPTKTELEILSGGKMVKGKKPKRKLTDREKDTVVGIIAGVIMMIPIAIGFAFGFLVGDQ